MRCSSISSRHSDLSIHPPRSARRAGRPSALRLGGPADRSGPVHATRGSSSGEFPPGLPLPRSAASVKSKPLSFKNAPGGAIKAQSKRVFAQRTRGRAFQCFPFPSISGAESRLINALRARGRQKLFSFLLLPGRRSASFQKFRRRASASSSGKPASRFFAAGADFMLHPCFQACLATCAPSARGRQVENIS